MEEELSAFVTRHRESPDPALQRLLAGLREGRVAFRSRSETGSVHLGRIYQIRSAIATDRERLTISSKFKAMSELFGTNDDQLCAIWLFEGAEHSVAVFEPLPAMTQVAVLEFDGPFEV